MFNFIALIQDRAVSTAAERYLLAYMLGVLVVVTTLIITFFIVFQKRKNKLLIDKIKQQQLFDEELSNAQTEIQEQTLKNIGWELHDNVGQLLSVASMQLSILRSKLPEELKAPFNDTNNVVRDSLREVRALSKSLNNDVILNIGIEKSISNELDRLKKMKFASAELTTHGESIPFKNKKHEIIIFRILQEFFSNAVKYSKAEHIKVIVSYNKKSVNITAIDDGIGFNINTVEKGSGLINMTSRAVLVNAVLTIDSKEGGGVKLSLDYPIE